MGGTVDYIMAGNRVMLMLTNLPVKLRLSSDETRRARQAEMTDYEWKHGQLAR